MNQSSIRLGWPGIAALIADEHEGRSPHRTPVRVRLSEGEAASRRAMDVPPKATPKKSLLTLAEELMELDSDLYTQLVNMRGGCRCCISPPCNACVEPITEAEARRLLDEDDEEPPKADADSWIEWHGGECPIPGQKCVVRMSCGLETNPRGCISGSSWDWRHDQRLGRYTIIAYKVLP